MREEIAELKKKDNQREKELEELKKKIVNRDVEKSFEPEYALDFDKNAFLQMGFKLLEKTHRGNANKLFSKHVPLP
jgi:hypothetical protein